MKIAVVGATGLVGTEMFRVMEELNFPVTELIPVASEASKGKLITFKGEKYPVVDMETGISAKADIALFSAGSGVSRTFAPRFADMGTTVIDNSSAWRMEPEIPLIVPEVNFHALNGSKIIANPNCSTIQLVVALAPLHARYHVKRLIISTYQSVTGTGKAALDQLMGERKGEASPSVYPKKIDLNCLPHCDIFLDNDYTKEEMKLVHETRKIMGEPSMRVTATAVRIPVIGGHSESVNIEFEEPYEVNEVRKVLTHAEGIIVKDDPHSMDYPTLLDAHGRNEVFVGRIRRDESIENGLNMWVVADNLRKGAATNAVQIALKLTEKGVVNV